jgi:restriction endonuclease S subunit
MKKYTSYKDSGVEWIGEIPSGWEFLSLKSICDLTTQTISKEELNEKRLIHYSIPNVQEFGKGVEEEGNDIDSSKILLNGGEVLLSKLNPRKSCVTIVGNEEEMKVGSGEFLSFLPKKDKLTNKFLFYLFKNQRFTDYLDSSVESVTRSHQRVRPEVVYLSKIVIPPLSEQQQIVSYLDTKTSLIDSLIEKTQRKIQLLKENRTSLINEVVTKGLNPNVEMKDSGVEWIGEIPCHWELKRLKYFCELVNEKGLPNEGDVKISPENVESNTGFCFNLYSEYSGEGVKFSEGDILLNKLRLYLKKILFTEYEGYSMGEMIVLRVFNGVKRFYYLTLFHQGLIDELDNQSTGVKLPRVSPEIILNTKFPFPPISEQNEIVSYLDEHTQLIDKTVSIEERRIELLKEYRQSLISEVVTGKRKVTTDE